MGKVFNWFELLSDYNGLNIYWRIANGVEKEGTLSNLADKIGVNMGSLYSMCSREGMSFPNKNLYMKDKSKNIRKIYKDKFKEYKGDTLREKINNAIEVNGTLKNTAKKHGIKYITFQKLCEREKASSSRLTKYKRIEILSQFKTNKMENVIKEALDNSKTYKEAAEYIGISCSQFYNLRKKYGDPCKK